MVRGEARKFVFVKGTNKTYNEQGFIFFTCATIKKQPEEVQQKILNTCIEVGGVYYKALYEFMTNTYAEADCIARENFTNEKKVYTMRKKFYNAW